MKDYNKAVKHPSHYTEGRKFEPKDVIRDWRLNFNLGSALKYIARAGRKDDIVQDLKKAQEYLQFEIDAIEAERSKEVEPKAPQHPNCRCIITHSAEVKKVIRKADEREKVVVNLMRATGLSRAEVLDNAIRLYTELVFAEE